jgi:hypothetical protein
LSDGALATTLPGRETLASLRGSTAARTAICVAPVGLALLLWALSFRWIDLSRMSDFGLLPALPWTFYAALAVLTVSFVFTLRPAWFSEPVLALHVAALIVIVHGTPTIAYGTLRYAWAWKHVGIVDYIQRHGSVDPGITFLSAYHNWPGFFALSALYTQLAGYGSALGVARWGPVFFNFLFFGALIVLFRSLTGDRRRLWLGLWFFFATSWIGQDYFSPQAFAYFLFLVALTVCLTWFRLTQAPGLEAVRRYVPFERGATWFAGMVSRGEGDAGRYVSAGHGERVAMALLVIGLATVVATSHQLTPYMLVLGVGGLVVLQRISLRSLPVLVAVISVGWVVLFAVGFLRGNLYWVVDSLGTLTTNANSNLINLSQASHGQQVVARIDRALTAGVWLLGALGFARLALRRRLDLSAGVLAVAPFAMLGATSYGGEILFRVYFFSLPFFALLATALFYPDQNSGGSRLGTAACGLASATLIAGLLVAYYGRERQNYFSKGEVRAAQVLYGEATHRSLLVAGVNDYPWAFTHYEDFSYLSLADLRPIDRRHVIARPAETIASIGRNDKVPCAYVIITSSEEATVDMTGVMPPGSLAAIERRLSRSTRFHVLLRNPSTTVVGTPVKKSASACHLSG